jgi:hypothetical protein
MTKTKAADRMNWEGVLIEGTMRPCDTIPAMLEALAELAPAAYQQAQMPGFGFSMVPDEAIGDEGHEFWSSERADWAFDCLFEALNENAPEGLTFGTAEGDGACLGFWPVEDDSEEDDEPTGPVEEDIIIADIGSPGYSVGIVGGKHLGNAPFIEGAEAIVKSWLKRNSFYPTVWFQDDHGGFSIYTLEK